MTGTNSIRVLILIVALGLVGPGLVSAETSVDTPLRLGAEFAINVPQSEWGDVTNIGIGGFAKLSYIQSDHLRITTRFGLLFHPEKTIDADPDQGTTAVDFSTNEVHFLGGVEWGAPIAFDTRGFLFAEIGFSALKGTTTDQATGTKEDVNDNGFGATIGLGVGYKDVIGRMGIIVPDLSETKNAYAILFTLGGDFLAF